jgi:predicted TIM-barrel fold metal-dependent hydrolase
MRDIPFVDAHVHLWDLQRIHYPWLTPPFSDAGPNGSVEAIARTYLLDDYLADAAGWDVRGIVHVEAGATPSAALAETEWLQDMADARGMPNAIVASAALDDPQVGTLLAAHASHPNVRAVRHIVNWHPDPNRTYTPRDLTADDGWAAGFALLGQHGLSFDLQAYPAQFGTLARILARHDDTPVCVNHAGMLVPGDGEDGWRDGLRALAALPHVAVKISGMGFVWRQWSLDQARGYVLATIDLFGPGRVMFASDFPTDKLFGSFDRHLDAYAAITADFTREERHAMFAGNANRIYRLGLTL